VKIDVPTEFTLDELLAEVREINAVAPPAQPGDLTAQQVADEFGRSVTQARTYLAKMEKHHGWTSLMAYVNGRETRVWRKPTKEDAGN